MRSLVMGLPSHASGGVVACTGCPSSVVAMRDVHVVLPCLAKCVVPVHHVVMFCFAAGVSTIQLSWMGVLACPSIVGHVVRLPVSCYFGTGSLSNSPGVQRSCLGMTWCLMNSYLSFCQKSLPW